MRYFQGALCADFRIRAEWMMRTIKRVSDTDGYVLVSFHAWQSLEIL